MDTPNPEIILTDERHRCVTARYQLPTHIWVDSTVLGAVTETRIGGAVARIHVPGVNENGDVVIPELPQVDVGLLAAAAVPWVRRFAAITTDPRAVALCVVAMELSEDPSMPLGDVPYTDGTIEHRIITAAGTSVAWWFDIVRTWIELFTVQDLDHRHPVYDANTIGPGFEAWRDGAFADVGFTLSTPRINAVTLDDWCYALDQAGQCAYPPVQYVTARDARAAYVRGDYRKAVLDAATSAEVTLARVYDEEWPKHVTQPPLGRSSLDAYVNWLLSRGVVLAVAKDRIDELREARNQVIHSGAATTPDTAANAVDTAYRLASTHAPLE